MTLMPCTPKACMVFRSAWMPAPPPESEPATVRTRGGGVVTTKSLRTKVLVPTERLGPRSAGDGHRAGLTGRHGEDPTDRGQARVSHGERDDEAVIVTPGQDELTNLIR